jgi:hypothetical protein
MARLMQFRAIVKAFALLILALLISVPPARAAEESSCPRTMALTMRERDAIGMFHARLSHLLYKYGKPDFEASLEKIVKESWPKAKVIQVSASFVERALNMVDQARLRHAVALTAGLDNEAWDIFEREMKRVTLMDGYVVTKWDQFPKQTIKLYEAIKKSRPSNKNSVSPEQYEVLKAEAIARVSDMASYLLRWSVINRGLLDERAAVAHKQLAVIGIGVIGGGVMVSTMIASGAIVAGAGAYAGSLSANPATAALLTKLGEVAGGVALGVVGAPAAQAISDSHRTYSEAKKQSENLQTSFSCELGKQMKAWKDRGASPYLTAALYGGGLGAVGGTLTLSRVGSQVVLYGTTGAVAIAQTSTLLEAGSLSWQSIEYFRLAQEASDAGDHDKALKLLFKARDLSQEAQSKGLESVIIATLSAYIVGNFRTAMVQGEQAIRTMYANSADTIPLAGKAALSAIPKTSTVPLSDPEER